MRSKFYFHLSFCLVVIFFLFVSDLMAQLDAGKVILGRTAARSRNMSLSPFRFYQQDWFRLGAAHLNRREGNGHMIRFGAGVLLTKQLLLKSDFTYHRYSDRFLSYEAYEINPALRYYFKPLGERTYPFAELGFGYFSTVVNVQGDLISAEAGLGITHFLTPSVALEGQLTYNRSDLSGENVGSNYLFSAGLGIALGEKEERRIVPALGRGTLAVGLSDVQLGVFREEFRGSSLSIQPHVMYFFLNRLAIGLDLQFDFNRRRVYTFQLVPGGENYAVFETNTSFAITPMIRYQAAGGQRLSFFFETGLRHRRYEYFRSDATLAEEVTNDSSRQIIGGTGFSFFITDHVALEFGPEMAYDLQRNESNYFLSTGFQVFLR